MLSHIDFQYIIAIKLTKIFLFLVKNNKLAVKTPLFQLLNTTSFDLTKNYIVMFVTYNRIRKKAVAIFQLLSMQTKPRIQKNHCKLDGNVVVAQIVFTVTYLSVFWICIEENRSRKAKREWVELSAIIACLFALMRPT